MTEVKEFQCLKCGDCYSEQPIIPDCFGKFLHDEEKCETSCDDEVYKKCAGKTCGYDDDELKKRIQRMIHNHHTEYGEQKYYDDERHSYCDYDGDPIYDLAGEIVELIRGEKK